MQSNEMQNFDLFGNPYTQASRQGGRPNHEPTQETIVNVMVLLASGQTNKEIASTLGLDVKTLARHYGHLLKQRAAMLGRLRSKLRTAQIQQGLAGNATALASALKMLDGVDAERVSRSLADRAANKSSVGYVSKKEQRLETARSIGGKFAVPSGPRLAASNGQAVQSEDEG